MNGLFKILKHSLEYTLAHSGFSIRCRPIAESKYVGILPVLGFCGRCFKVLYFLESLLLFEEVVHIRMHWYVDFQVETDVERVLLFYPKAWGTSYRHMHIYNTHIQIHRQHYFAEVMVRCLFGWRVEYVLLKIHFEASLR